MRLKKETSTSYLLKDPKTLKKEKKRLKLQAKALFELELPYLSKIGIKSRKKILDLGCGTAYYLSLIEKKIPSAKTFGIDRNPELLAEAKKNCKTRSFFEIRFDQEKLLSKTIIKIAPDLVILRFVLQHMSTKAKSTLLETLKNTLPKNAIVVIIEPDDTKIRCVPACHEINQLIKRTIKRQKLNGGDRTIGSSLKKTLIKAGFQKSVFFKTDAGSDSLGWEDCESIYLAIWGYGISPTDNKYVSLKKKAANWMRTGPKNRRLLFPIFIAAGKV